MMSSRGQCVCSEMWVKEGSSHSTVGVKKNTVDLGLPFPISTKESVNILHIEVSCQTSFG